MDRKQIAIATITLARNDQETCVLTGALKALTALGIPVYVTDGGSSPAFLELLHTLPNTHVVPVPAKGVWPQAASSLRAASASGANYIFYTEPDKHWFFEQVLPRMLDTMHPSGQTGVVLASRSLKGFQSFPNFQQLTEETINQCCAELMQQQVDYTYGPFIIKRELVSCLDWLHEDVGWGWRPFFFNVAVRLGYSFEAFEADLMCPDDQRQDNASERVHRMNQLAQNIRGLVLSTQIVIPPAARSGAAHD